MAKEDEFLFENDKKPDDKIRAEPAPQNQTDTSTSSVTKKRGRGRRSKADLEREKLEKQEQERELSQKRLQAFKEPVSTGLRVLFNDALFSRFPEEAAIPPLSQAEINALTDALLPVLDQLGWLDVAGNPYLNLTLVSFAVFYPRVTLFMKYKKQKSGQIEEPKADASTSSATEGKKDEPQKKRTGTKRTGKP